MTSQRDVASLFQSNSQKQSLSYEWEFSSEPSWVIRPGIKEIHSIDIFSTEVICSGDNTVEVRGENKITFYVTEQSQLRCRGKEQEKIQVSYHFFESTLVQVSNEQVKSLGSVLEMINNNNMPAAIDELKDLGLYDLFEQKIYLSELNKLPFKEGDYLSLEIWPQLNQVHCPNGNCQMTADVFGLLDYEKVGYLNGMNQLRYQDIPPFLFFCGSRFAAGNIYFRADERMHFDHVVDVNGFSCDINTFMLEEKVFDYEMKVTWISKEKILTILMGKPEQFIYQKNLSYKKKIENHIKQIQYLNQLHHRYFNVQQQKKTFPGHIELWWEPFEKCQDLVGKKSLERCEQKEMIMTRSRLIFQKEDSLITKELELASLGLKQTITSPEELIALTLKICPQDIESFIFDHIQKSQKVLEKEEFLSNLKNYEKGDCQLTDDDEGKNFDYRWLLASIPTEIEKEEVDLIIEDYQVLESPEPKKLNSDPLQRGKIFFDVYLKNLKRRQVPFQRSRIIEIAK